VVLVTPVFSRGPASGTPAKRSNVQLVRNDLPLRASITGVWARIDGAF